jgi:DNA-binding response OmpR family regulator
MRYKVLVVDDEEESREALKGLLDARGWSTVLAGGAAEALEAARRSRPDVVLTDVCMPGRGGLELCRSLKADARTAALPVVLMSGARREDDAQVEGLDAGADDYLLKPLEPRLLAAKLEAVLRRGEPAPDLREVLKAHGLVIDVEARTVTGRKGRLSLTRKEFDLLTTFLRKPGRVLSTAYLLETVWGYDPAVYNDPHTVETHLSSLRRKTGPALGRRFVNVPGLGYRFERDA